VSRIAIFRTVALAWWLVMTAWLVRFEAFPQFFTHAIAGYDGLLGRDILLSDTWMKIVRDGRPAGYVRTNVEVNEYDARWHVVVENRLHLTLDLLGATQTVAAQGTAYLDMLYELQHFDFTLASDLLKIRVTGERRQGRQFAIRTETGGRIERATIEIPADAIVHSPLATLAVKRMHVGEHVRLRTLNPLTMAATDVDVRALRRETITVEGRPAAAIVLGVEYLGASFLSWISPDGDLLRQESPLGLTLEKCSAREALESVRDSRGNAPAAAPGHGAARAAAGPVAARHGPPLRAGDTA
jgi:hypothetical protein